MIQNKNWIAIGLTAVMSLWPFASACAGASTGIGMISQYYVHAEWTMVRVDSLTDNPDGCYSTEYYAIEPSQPNYSALNAALLSAQMAGKRVKFWVDGCGGQGAKYPFIRSVFTYTD